MSRLFVCVVALLSGILSDRSSHAAHWRAGVAKTIITPDESMLMAGYGSRTEPADGKLTELWAKALVIEDPSRNRGVIVTLDLIGIDHALSRKITQSLDKKFGLKRKQIVICTSHTHTGPAVGMNLAPMHYLLANPEQQEQIDSYTSSVHDAVVATVDRALARLQPAQLSWGSGRCSFAVNRRENKPYEDVPNWRSSGVLKGPVDHDVPVLAVRDVEGKLVSVLFGYACHATVLADQKWSGDYPAFAQTELEQQHPDCIAMFWAGCGADQNPLPRRSVVLAAHYGRQLATAVNSVLLTSAMTEIQGELLTAYEEIDLPLDELPSEAQLGRDAQSADRFVASRARMLLRQLESGQLEQTYRYPISTWSIGKEIQFIALGGEVVVDYAVRLKSEQRGIRTWIAGYANDVMAYIPSRRVLREGGYEGGGAMVYYGLPTVWAPSVEEDIVGSVGHQLERLNERTAIDIGSRLELFTDETLVAKIDGEIAREIVLPEPKEVVFVADQPWEGNTSGYYSLFQAGDRFRMIYRGWQHDENKNAAHAEVTCYAESKDGITWTRPKLGLFEWNQSKENNIVWLGPGSHNFSAFLDANPNRSPAAAFKAFGGSGGTGGLSRGLLPFGSVDCVRWNLLSDEPVITHGAFDSQNLAFWDTDRREYRAYWRYFGDGVRAIRTATSEDFVHWENEADLEYPNGTPLEHLYTNAIQKYFRAPHLFIGFPTRFEPQSQQVEPILMTSRDGVHFERWPDPVVPRTAPKDRNHNRSNYMASGILQLPGKPNEVSVYATENYYESTPGRLRRFAYRTDGFVAVKAGAQGGSLTTRPLTYRGKQLIVNFRSHDGGSLRVVALDRTGQVLYQSETLQGDSTNAPVRWLEKVDSTSTQVVQLSFQMTNAELYSFRFTDAIN